MYSEELSALQIWSCLAALRILLNLLNLHLTLLSCLSVLRVLLNLLTPFALAFPASTLGCGCCYCCCCLPFPCSLGGSRAFHFSDFFQASAGSSSHFARPAWSAGLFLPCYQSLNGVIGHLKSVVQPVCDAIMPVICSCRTK